MSIHIRDLLDRIGDPMDKVIGGTPQNQSLKTGIMFYVLNSYPIISSRSGRQESVGSDANGCSGKMKSN